MATQTLNRVRRRWILLSIAGIIVLLIVLSGLASFYVDVLWFRSIGQSPVFWRILWSRLFLGAVFGAAFFILLYVNLRLVQRMVPRFRVFSPEQQVIERYRGAAEPYLWWAIPVFAAVIAFFVGLSTSGQWETFLLWRSVGDVTFGAQHLDPVFHRDPAFYIFVLPFHKFVQGWLFDALVGVTVLTAIAHYLTGGIRPQAAGERVSPQVKAHLSVLIGIILLVKAWGYYLGRFDLLTSHRGVVSGASYTDVHAELPALQLLMFIAIACGLLFLANIRFRGWALPVVGIGLLWVVSIVAGAIVPAVVQRFEVAPQQYQREAPYIQRNIDATRYAYGLNTVESSHLNPEPDVTAQQVQANAPTVDNIRLWAPDILRTTYDQLQRIQPYYEFSDVDVDRYKIGGRERMVMISAREVSQNRIPGGGRTWQNTHLVYTHGYGAVASQVNTATSTGQPDFLLQNIPPQGNDPALSLTPRGSQIYFGERSDVPFVVVDTKSKELNYPQSNGEGSTFTQYEGQAGIPVGDLLTRLALAWHFHDFNLLISGLIDNQSKILINRAISQRVRALAPFLRYDADPYAAIVDGQLVYIQDAYTTTDSYPYSQPVNLSRVTDGDMSGQINYIRNSVKIVMNAYTGALTLYVVDPSDPLVQVWERAFPGLFTTAAAPEAIQAHYRYPEDLMMVQSSQFTNYHVTNSQTFYNKDDFWAIPGALAGEPKVPPPPERFRPYYVILRLPGDTQEQFVLFQPFTPFNRQNMVAYMVGGSDPGQYGRLRVVELPTSENVDGPSQVRNFVSQDPKVSAEVTLLSQAGSQVLYGDLMIVPIDNGFMYVQPLFVQSSQGNPIPELKRVVVVHGGAVTLGSNLPDTVAASFGHAPPPPSQGGVPPPSTTDVGRLLDEAIAHFQQAQTDLRNGDLAGYQREIDAAERLVRQANGQSSGAKAPSPSPSPSPSG